MYVHTWTDVSAHLKQAINWGSIAYPEGRLGKEHARSYLWEKGTLSTAGLGKPLCFHSLIHTY